MLRLFEEDNKGIRISRHSLAVVGRQKGREVGIVTGYLHGEGGRPHTGAPHGQNTLPHHSI
ncbi:hypothetical protein BGX38DRAFT_1173818 [Terfezia claveryi]|nr:hypothetical protein BGX38DRAFT_1173818 [Terfezia claveryi]